MNIQVTASPQSDSQQCSGAKTGSAPRNWVVQVILAAEWLVLIVGAGYLCGRTIPRAWQHLDTDFPNYYLTADQGVHFSNNDVDRLAVAAKEDKIWVEESRQESRLVSLSPDLRSEGLEVYNGESPVISADGKWMAYLRSNRGRSRIWLRALKDAATADQPITPIGLNVFEMSFLADNSIVFAAAEDRHVPHLLRTDGPDQLRSVADEPSRYPSVSPDGRWLAYGRQSGGVWNLWLRDLHSEQDMRVTSADCNDIFPSWEADSKTLVLQAIANVA